MKTGQATGLQIAFLMFAVMLVAVPISNLIVRHASLSGPGQALIEKGMHFGLACALLACIPGLRRFTRRMLFSPIPKPKRIEVALVSLGHLAQGFATAAAIAMLLVVAQGPSAIEGMASRPERDFAQAISDSGLVRLFLAVLVAPLVEELVFRGLIYQAFERQWGWFVAMIATSILFGWYHPYFWSAFFASIILVCVYRRTGALRASIVVHGFFNLMMWWPLLGRFIFPAGPEISDPKTWYFHGVCLFVVTIWIPIYVWMSRDRTVLPPTQFLAPNVPLQK